MKRPATTAASTPKTSWVPFSSDHSIWKYGTANYGAAMLSAVSPEKRKTHSSQDSEKIQQRRHLTLPGRLNVVEVCVHADGLSEAGCQLTPACRRRMRVR